MAQYRNLIKPIRTFPTYAWKEDLKETQTDFIVSLEVGEIFAYPRYLRDFEKFKEQFEKREVIIDIHQFKIKQLQKDYPTTAIVLQKGKEVYQKPIEEAQTFDTNSILT